MKKFTSYICCEEYMQAKADIVIIGGGIVGTAVAFYLARERMGSVVLVEKEKFLGAGSTAKAAGGVRAQFHNKANIEMSMLSKRLLCRFKEDTGADAAFDQVGYLFLLSDDKDIRVFQDSYKLQKSLGLDVHLLKPDEIARRAPHVRIDDIKMATFCPDDGLIDPHEFVTGYEQAARRYGAEFRLESEVLDIGVTSGRISGVRTANGEISTPLVINCAGAYSGKIARMAGADVSIKPYRRQCVTTGELDSVTPDLPMVVDVRTGFYCHPESKGLLLGWSDKSVKASFDISIDPDYTDSILELALDRLPQLETAEVANQWAGLYETTPDHRAIIGWAGEVDGMFHNTGYSGHGLMHAPAAGLITSEILAGKKPSVDVESFSPQRFAAGTIVEETNVI
ncbi:MAG: FAD-binding oxidoreductase [Candidatus Zixiibacteriota bacterium]|nr:MAG: FAD-binding oxidoreductase [candidate division Zixibacteria bacterium]